MTALPTVGTHAAARPQTGANVAKAEETGTVSAVTDLHAPATKLSSQGFIQRNAPVLAAVGIAAAATAAVVALRRSNHGGMANGLALAAAGGILLSACSGGGSKPPTDPNPDPVDPPNGDADKISPFSSSENAILVQLSARPENEAEIAAMPRGAARKEAAWEALNQTAAASQPTVVKIAENLKSTGEVKSYERLVSPNMVIVEVAPGQDMNAIARKFDVDGVQGIYNNGTARQMLTDEGDGSTEGALESPEDLTPAPLEDGGVAEKNIEDKASPVDLKSLSDHGWGVDRIGAPAAWDQGATGAGLTYGSIDTGVQWSHKALRDSYRGASGGSVDHNYNWMDFDRSSQEPTDADGHGTHTTGNVVGYAKDEDIRLGVARDSKFIAARALGNNTDALVRALQFMQAPTKLDGSAARPDLAPDVVGMSWRAGSPREALFQEAFRNLRLAGIEPVVAAGNSGPNGFTVTNPGALPEAITIGATDSAGLVADFSSRGPNLFPGSSALKPDLMAPGVETASTYPDNKYARLSGTSMAQPHASGAILDILSKYPDLTHDQLMSVLRDGAIDGGIPGPDDDYGNGEINLPGALAAAERLTNGEQQAAA